MLQGIGPCFHNAPKDIDDADQPCQREAAAQALQGQIRVGLRIGPMALSQNVYLWDMNGKER